MQYKRGQQLYQNIKEPDTVPPQIMVIIKIVPEKDLYQLKGTQDGLIYDYPKSYLDVFMRPYPTHC